MRKILLGSSRVGLALLLATASAEIVYGQYQDSSAESARGYSNSRVQSNISDQGSGYGPYGPYGPYYSSGAPNQNRQQNGNQPRQTRGLPDLGLPLSGDPNLPSWYGLRPGRQTQPSPAVTWAEDNGFLVARDVPPESDLSRAGLQVGDVLVSVNEKQVKTKSEWQKVTAAISSGRSVPVEVRRDGTVLTLNWTPTTPGEDDVPGPAGLGSDGAGVIDFITAARLIPGPQGHGRLGIELDDQYPDRAVVKTVEGGGAAAQAGLRPGDVILSVSGRAVSSISELVRIVSQSVPDGTVEMYVRRNPELSTEPEPTAHEEVIPSPSDEAAPPSKAAAAPAKEAAAPAKDAATPAKDAATK